MKGMEIRINKRIIGKYGEYKASEYLEEKNYEVINKNYYCKYGEIDIIAFDKNSKELVFVEVKTRTNIHYGRPIEAITNKKINHLKKTINYYIMDKKAYNFAIRIDAIEILIIKNKCYINHVKSII